jgi:hypothetical protein
MMPLLRLRPHVIVQKELRKAHSVESTVIKELNLVSSSFRCLKQ